jgi:transposase
VVFCHFIKKLSTEGLNSKKNLKSNKIKEHQQKREPKYSCATLEWINKKVITNA